MIRSNFAEVFQNKVICKKKKKQFPKDGVRRVGMMFPSQHLLLFECLNINRDMNSF